MQTPEEKQAAIHHLVHCIQQFGQELSTVVPAEHADGLHEMLREVTPEAVAEMFEEMPKCIRLDVFRVLNNEETDQCLEIKFSVWGSHLLAELAKEGT